MATQQHPALDSNQSLPSAPSLRDEVRRKEYCAPAPQRGGNVHYGQLWLGGFLGARSWKVLEGNKRVPGFEAKWEGAKDAIDASCQALRAVVASGQKLHGEGEAL